MAEDWESGGFGLYLHWPFCEAKCPYCDFNSYASTRIDHRGWQAAYLAELRRVAALTPGRALDSVYFGGGTPGLMDPATVAAILAKVAHLWPLSNALEITLEANPGSVEVDRFRAFRAAGINRVSLGIQAMDDADLQALGRVHSVAEALQALEIARTTFNRVSFDLIYSRQNQTLQAWRRELTEALQFDPEHLSLYQLTIEPGTAFADRHNRGTLRGLPSEELGAKLYDTTQDICEQHGLPAYEISNHAKPGQESRHNMIYWHCGDYIGIGPGAHGRLTLDGQRYAIETVLAPGKWQEAVAAGSGETMQEPINAVHQAEEYLMMSLRTNAGLDHERFARLAGRGLSTGRVAALSEQGLIVQSGPRLCATAKGRPLLNAVIRDLLVE